MRPDSAIVTGSARGIGAAIAERLHRSGWRVVGLDRAWEGEQPGHLAAMLHVDVASSSEVESDVGPVGVVVMTADASKGGPA